MLVHAWRRVEAGIFHDFHMAWAAELRRSLNEGLLPQGYYVLVEQHTGPHDPSGMHGSLLQALHPSPEPYVLPANAPLTLASYVAGPQVDIYIEHFAVGSPLPEMPLFLRPDRYVNVPLEPTYQAAYRGTPAVWREVLESGDPQLPPAGGLPPHSEGKRGPAHPPTRNGDQVGVEPCGGISARTAGVDRGVEGGAVGRVGEAFELGRLGAGRFGVGHRGRRGVAIVRRIDATRQMSKGS